MEGFQVHRSSSSCSSSSTAVDAMGSKRGFEALRGEEVHVLDLIFQASTSEQWGELLKGPLECVAGQGNRGIALKLVEAGAQIGLALHEAVRGGHGEVVTDLLESGAPINAKHATNGSTPLHVAAEEGRTEVVELLMLKGADKDAMDDEECTPLFAAVRFGHVAAALALLAGGADVSVRNGTTRITVAHMAALKGQVDILRATIEHGADVGTDDAVQRTALHFSAAGGKAEAVDVLMEAGANIEARNSNGGTPLQWAAEKLNLEALTALTKHGACVNTQNSYLRTPLHRAVFQAGTYGAAEVVDFLLRSGADETIVCSNGKAAADVVGDHVEEKDRLAEDVERVRRLLANAPADRAWRRRGYLVLCRAHADRVQRAPESSSARTRAEQASTVATGCNGTVGGKAIDGRSSDEWIDVVAGVLRLQNEGVFRTIVGYL